MKILYFKRCHERENSFYPTSNLLWSRDFDSNRRLAYFGATHAFTSKSLWFFPVPHPVNGPACVFVPMRKGDRSCPQREEIEGCERWEGRG